MSIALKNKRTALKKHQKDHMVHLLVRFKKNSIKNDFLVRIVVNASLKYDFLMPYFLKRIIKSRFFDALFYKHIIKDRAPLSYFGSRAILLPNFYSRVMPSSSTIYFLNLISFGHTNPNIIDSATLSIIVETSHPHPFHRWFWLPPPPLSPISFHPTPIISDSRLQVKTWWLWFLLEASTSLITIFVHRHQTIFKTLRYVSDILIYTFDS